MGKSIPETQVSRASEKFGKGSMTCIQEDVGVRDRLRKQVGLGTWTEHVCIKLNQAEEIRFDA